MTRWKGIIWPLLQERHPKAGGVVTLSGGGGGGYSQYDTLGRHIQPKGEW